MELKVCGMRDLENIQRLISEVSPDWMGLIFYPKSPRYVSGEQAAELKAFPVKKVGVFVNETETEILEKVRDFGLSAIQLHGSESPDFVKSLAEKTETELWKVVSVGAEIDWESLSEKTETELWKVVSVGAEIDWKSLEGYLPFISKFLFDTATEAHGGSGKRFNWKVLETYPFNKGFLLSGGLDEDSAAEVLALRQQIPQLQGVDLNSKFEDAPGVKNIEKLIRFKNKIDHS